MIPCRERYGEGDGALLMGWNYCWVRLGPIGYSGDLELLKFAPVLDKDCLPWYDWKEE
jgi:hypothetical protein